MNMPLPDYAYYQDIYLGDRITEYDFPRLIKRAGTYLKALTYTDTGEENLKMAACAVAEAWQVNEQGGDVASESVATWQKSYAAKKPVSDARRLLDAARLYLVCSSVRWV